MSKHKKERKQSQRQLKRRAAKAKKLSVPQGEEYLLYEYEITDGPLFDAEYRKTPPVVLAGTWHICEMEAWDEEYFNMELQARRDRGKDG